MMLNKYMKRFSEDILIPVVLKWNPESYLSKI